MKKIDINLDELVGASGDNIQSSLNSLSSGLNNSGFKEFMSSLGSSLGLTWDCNYAVQCLEAAAEILNKSRDHIDRVCSHYSISLNFATIPLNFVTIVATINNSKKNAVIISYESSNQGHACQMDTFLQPLKHAGLTKEIRDIKYIVYEGDSKLRTFMFSHLSEVDIVISPGNPSTGAKSIFMDASYIQLYGKYPLVTYPFPYDAFFHELGHALFFCIAGTYGNRVAYDERLKALLEIDFDNIIGKYQNYGNVLAELKNPGKDAILSSTANIIGKYRSYGNVLAELKNPGKDAILSSTAEIVISAFKKDLNRFTYAETFPIIDIYGDFSYGRLGSARDYSGLPNQFGASSEFFAAYFSRFLTNKALAERSFNEYFPNSTSYANTKVSCEID